jgi:hypothetical protein
VNWPLLVATAVLGLGFGLVIYGVWLVYEPAGWIVAGLLAVSAALLGMDVNS